MDSHMPFTNEILYRIRIWYLVFVVVVSNFLFICGWFAWRVCIFRKLYIRPEGNKAWKRYLALGLKNDEILIREIEFFHPFFKIQIILINRHYGYAFATHVDFIIRFFFLSFRVVPFSVRTNCSYSVKYLCTYIRSQKTQPPLSLSPLLFNLLTLPN